MSAAAMMLSGAAAGGGAGFTTFKTITIDHTKAGSSDSSNFPMYFSITDAALKTVGNGGSVQHASAYDVVLASDSAGTTLLSWEVLTYDGAAGTIRGFVKIATLSHTTDPVIYMPIGKGTISTFQGGSTGAVWDSNFKGVYHMGDGSVLNVTDYSASTNTGTQHSGVTAATGPNGLGAASFAKASSQYVTTANTLNIAQPTIEAWVKMSAWPTGNAGTVAGVVQGNGGGTADKTLSVRTDGKVSFYCYDGAVKDVVSTGTVATGAFVYLAAIGDGTNIKIYINGSVDGSLACGNTFTGYTGAGLEIQGLHGGSIFSTYADMTMAEVRLSAVARSADWITATYNNINSPSTFYTVT
jgi:hypothetical protein